MKTNALRRISSVVGVLCLALLVACGSDEEGSADQYGAGGDEVASDDDPAQQGGGGDNSAADAGGHTSSGDAGMRDSTSDDGEDAYRQSDFEERGEPDQPADDALGAPCSSDGECPSGRCATTGGDDGGVCTIACDDDSACPAGWSCESDHSGEGRFCACDASAEICDGIDNDCDAIVDERTDGECDEQGLCVEGACGCPTGFDCDGSCRDLGTDPDHCGACGNSCEVACNSGRCTTPVSASVGADHLCARLDDGRVRCLGQNDVGQLGDGSTLPAGRPVDALWTDGAAEVVAGDGFSCARTEADQVYCWGRNRQGQVAEPPLTERHRPVRWESLEGIVDLDVRAYTGCAVNRSGSVLCWGPHGFDRPTEVEGLAGAREVAVGDLHRCALDEDGQVSCWGSNSAGQLGDGTVAKREEFAPVAGLDEAEEVVAGAEHTCARTAAGLVQCFGSNSDGQIGLPSEQRLEVSRPTTVDALPETSAITSGARHNCGLSPEDGRVYCWGANDQGQLGDGSTDGSSQPVAVHGLPSAAAVDAGRRTTCAITEDQKLYCWGEDYGVNPRRIRW